MKETGDWKETAYKGHCREIAPPKYRMGEGDTNEETGSAILTSLPAKLELPQPYRVELMDVHVGKWSPDAPILVVSSSAHSHSFRVLKT